MNPYQVVEARRWHCERNGRTASIYGALPFLSEAERDAHGWHIEVVGWTVYDTRRGTYGIGRQPFATREAAQAWVDAEHARLALLAR